MMRSMCDLYINLNQISTRTDNKTIKTLVVLSNGQYCWLDYDCIYGYLLDKSYKLDTIQARYQNKLKKSYGGFYKILIDVKPLKFFYQKL